MDKEPIFRGDLVYRKGRLAFAGNCSLTDDFLWFRPEALDRLAGARPWRLALDEVQRLELLGIECQLVISTAERNYELEGAGTLLLHRALRERMESMAHEHKSWRVHEDKRVIFEASMSLALPGGKPLQGEVSLTPKSFRFLPKSIRRPSEAVPDITIFIPDVHEVELRRDEAMLVLTTESSVLEVSGADAPILAEILRFLRSHQSRRLDTSLARRVRHYTEKEAAHGQLVVTSHRIRFVSEVDVLKEGGDSSDVELPAARVGGLYADPRTLTVRTPEGLHYFEMPEAGALVDQLAATWSHPTRAFVPALDAAGQFAERSDVQRLALTWSWVIEAELLQQPLLAGPVLLHIPGLRLERHILMLTHNAFLLLPVEGPTTEGGAIVFRNIGGLDPTAPELRRDRLEFQIGGRNVQLLPHGGAAFVSLFWDSIPRRIASAPEVVQKAQRKRSALTTYEDNRRESYRVSPVERYVGTMTVLAIPSQHVPEFEYDETPANGEEEEAVRRLIKAGDQLQYEMRDVSVEGMGVVMQEPLPTGAKVQVDLFDADSVFSIDAEVVNTRALPSKKYPFHSGLRVDEPEGDTRVRIQGLWTSLQRQRAARRAAP